MSAAEAPRPEEYNPFDPAHVDDHFATLADLRESVRVHQPMPGVYYVPRYDDIVEVCRRPEEFGQGGFEPLEADSRPPELIQLGESDPPEHTKVRRILAAALSPPRMRAYEPIVHEICAEIVDRFAGRGQSDLIEDLGAPLPAQVIGRLAGIPAEMRHRLRPYSDDLIGARAQPDPDEAHRCQQRVNAFDEELRAVIADRQRSSDRPDDLMTQMIEYRDEDGQPLHNEKILTTLSKDVIVGGIETTTHLIGNLFFLLLSESGLYERVQDDRSLVAMAVEETLRHHNPVQVLFRRARVDVDLFGTPVSAGEVVCLGYSAANRDPRVFDDPEAFRLDRPDPRRHLGFGWGIHLCVGAPLARLEATAGLNAVLDRIAHMELAPGADYQRVLFFMMRGPTRMDVVFDQG